MKYRRIEISKNRFIDIYDDVFDYAETSKMAMFAKRSTFKLERVPSVDLPDYLKFATLKSEYNIYELLSIGFILSPNLKFLRDRIKEEELRLHRVYLNLSTAQDIYTYHVDSEFDNETTVLYYVNTIWDPTWEGETHFSNEDGKDIIYSSAFIPNRVVYFSSTIPHKSSQPSFLAKDFRYTLTLKFSSKKTSKHFNDFPITDFFLDKEIELSEQEKFAIEFLKNKTAGINHSGQSLFDHLYKTFVILKNHNRSSEVCLAGLFHSVYGTEFYERIKLKDRTILQEIIGPKAEEIVYRFCNLSDRDTDLLDPNCKDYELIQIAYANLIEEKFRDQCHELEIINYKNKLEEIKR